MVWEYCPNCDNEVELQDKFEIQFCPECGEYLYPCSICPLPRDQCTNENCPLMKQNTKWIKRIERMLST